MHRIFVFLILTLLSILSSCGCETIPLFTNPADSTNVGTLKISLPDAPGDLDEVNITFSEIIAPLDSEWITVRGLDTSAHLLE